MPPTLPPSATLMQMVSGLWLSKLIGEVARLQIADLLVDGPKTAAELAPPSGTHAPSLFRALRALASVGIFGQDDHNRFSLTPLSELLRSDVPGSLRGLSMLITHDSHYRAWGALEHSLMTGEPAFDHVFGTDFFSYAAGDTDTQDVFNNAMTSFAAAGHVAAAQAYDFSPFGTLMDVGGGHGTLIASICAQTPGLRGILFDLPHVVAGATPVLEKWGVSERVEPKGGDFFAPLPSPVDACILSTVIHDWDDERSIKILRNCHAATKAGGKLLLVENVLPPGEAPSPGKFLDLNMLVMTPGGRERTQAEFRELYQKAGYQLTQIVPTHSPMCVVEGVRLD